MGFTPTFFPGFFIKKPLDIDTNTAFILTEKPWTMEEIALKQMQRHFDGHRSISASQFGVRHNFEYNSNRSYKVGVQYWHAGIDLRVIEIRNWNDDIGWLYEFIQAFIPDG